VKIIVPVLALVFILAKLFGVAPVAAWSWVWVLSPIWISFVVGLVVLGIVVMLKVWADS